MFKAFLFAFVANALIVGACGQKPNKVPESEEISLKFLTLFQRGETLIRRVGLETIPRTPSLPTGCAQVEGQSYWVRSSMIGSDGIVTVNVNAKSEEEFSSVRILELDRDELHPGGHWWRDCTTLPRTLDGLEEPIQPEHRRDIENYNREMMKYFPDFRFKKVSCSPGSYRGNGQDYYLVAVRQTQQPPKTSFTEIRFKLDETPEGGTRELRYVGTLTNVGKKDAAEVNLYSRFSADVDFVSVKSSQGNCGQSRRSSNAAVCHLGLLRAGQSVRIEFLGSPNPNGSDNPLGQKIPNEYWRIEGYVKEHAADPHWFANRFEFEPLKRQD